MRHAVLWIVLPLAFAGCLDPIAERLRAGDVEPPVWSVGDWWTYELTSDVYGTTSNVTVVVANATPGTYALGWPAGSDATVAMLQHVPALGPVRDDLRYEVHETRFEPVRFPLEDGAKWETTWITSTVQLTARISNGTWIINNTATREDDGMHYEIHYDPAARAISRFARIGLDERIRIEAVLVANGTGYQGDLDVPGPIRVALLESRTSGTFAGTTPAPPNPSFTVPAGTDTLLVGCIAGGAPGQYHAEVLSPTGTICQLDETIPPNDARMRVQIREVPAEDGAWSARLAAFGQGTALAEVLAYPLERVTLGDAVNATA